MGDVPGGFREPEVDHPAAATWLYHINQTLTNGYVANTMMVQVAVCCFS